MRLIDMLNTTVTPLSERVPTQGKVIVVAKPRGKITPHKAIAQAAINIHERTVARYRNAMGDGWVTTMQLEDIMEVGRSCVIGTLNKWEAKGIVERRKPCPDREWNRKKGFEWRMVK